MKWVFFDVDDTLVKVNEEVDIESSRRMFKEVLGVEGEDRQLGTGETELAVIKKVLFEKNVTGVENVNLVKAMERRGELLEDMLSEEEVRVLPGMRELIERIFGSGMAKAALLTGNSYWRTVAKLQVCGMDTWFMDRSGKLTGVFGNEEPTRPMLVELAMDRFVKPQDSIVLLDDSELGGETARSKKIPVILIATGKSDVEKLKTYSKFVFTDLGEGRWEEVYELVIKEANESNFI